MGLKIQTTGIEQFAPGGKARLKVMFIAGPGAGKTRVSSYWPRPLYGDCEGGLASVADRKVAYTPINSSKDMLDLLVFLKQECMKPDSARLYDTVVIDTLDAFQRKVKDEWLQQNNAQTFRGFDAWGYLDAKMQMLLTRLLNLDMNVIVNVHYKDKTIREGTGESAAERQELMLQLSGDVKDSVFNDFDLVGWIGTYWESVDGQRVEKRGLTFKRTPDKPFLKDRLFVTPNWMEITFSDSDYTNLFEAVTQRLSGLTVGEQVGEIPDAIEGPSEPTAGVVGPLSGGALPPQDPRDVPLHQFDKPTLQKMARGLGIKFAGNTLKGELIQMIEEARAKKEAEGEKEATAEQPAEQPAAEQGATTEQPAAESDAGSASPEQPAAGAPAAPAAETPSEPDVQPQDEPPTPSEDAATTVVPPASEQAKPPAEGAAETVVDKATGHTVDKATGEIVDMEQAVANVKEGLGGEVISETTKADAPPSAPAAPAPTPAATPAATTAAPSEGLTCAECGRDLSDQNPNWVKLSHIKWRKHLCDEHFLAAKAAS
jgi:hypothetical protein